MLLLAGILLILAVFLPMWRIELTAPQYPEGLVLQLHANKIAGDVDIINGLNHYIGMKTLHTEDFIEFKILPYILMLFGLCAFAVIFVKKKKVLYTLFISLVIFGVIAACDFYRWNYQYGHNLDPNAAIRVPGMSYQPPLLGYKQLLNFGAYSIPDSGGWLLITAGALLFAAVIKETKWFLRVLKRKNTLAFVFPILFLAVACADGKSVAIKLNTDSCDFCKMGIADGQFGAELITQKGRVYKFDDLKCMIGYGKENSDTKIKNYYVHDYTKNNVLIPAETAFYLSGGNIKSPMHGNIIAFPDENQVLEFAKQLQAEPILWREILGE